MELVISYSNEYLDKEKVDGLHQNITNIKATGIHLDNNVLNT